jgi:hypothetical protein
MYELDMNLLHDTTEFSTGILLTGIGNNNAPCKAIQIERGGLQNWTTGLDIKNCAFGIGITAYQPILIRTSFFNNQTQTSAPCLHGILFDNFAEAGNTTRGLLIGEQLVNNADCICLRRNTDSTPTGNYLTCWNKATDTLLCQIDIAGNIKNPDSYIFTKNIRLNQTPVSGAITCDKYITLYDANNNAVKVPCL